VGTPGKNGGGAKKGTPRGRPGAASAKTGPGTGFPLLLKKCSLGCWLCNNECGGKGQRRGGQGETKKGKESDEKGEHKGLSKKVLEGQGGAGKNFGGENHPKT